MTRISSVLIILLYGIIVYEIGLEGIELVDSFRGDSDCPKYIAKAQAAEEENSDIIESCLIDSLTDEVKENLFRDCTRNSEWRMLLLIATILVLTLSLFFMARDLPHIITTEEETSWTDHIILIFPMLLLAGLSALDAFILYKDCPGKANYPEDTFTFKQAFDSGSSLGSMNSPLRQCINQAVKIFWLWLIRSAYMVEQIDHQGRISPKVKLLIFQLTLTIIVVYQLCLEGFELYFTTTIDPVCERYFTEADWEAQMAGEATAVSFSQHKNCNIDIGIQAVRNMFEDCFNTFTFRKVILGLNIGLLAYQLGYFLLKLIEKRSEYYILFCSDEMSFNHRQVNVYRDPWIVKTIHCGQALAAVEFYSIYFQCPEIVTLPAGSTKIWEGLILGSTMGWINSPILKFVYHSIKHFIYKHSENISASQVKSDLEQIEIKDQERGHGVIAVDHVEIELPNVGPPKNAGAPAGGDRPVAPGEEQAEAPANNEGNMTDRGASEADAPQNHYEEPARVSESNRSFDEDPAAQGDDDGEGQGPNQLNSSRLLMDREVRQVRQVRESVVRDMPEGQQNGHGFVQNQYQQEYIPQPIGMQINQQQENFQPPPNQPPAPRETNPNLIGL